MPALIITDSTNVKSFDYNIVLDTINKKATVDLMLTQWHPGGNEKVKGARIAIATSGGLAVATGTQLDIIPPMTGEKSFNLPTIGGKLMFTTYLFKVTLVDENNREYSVSKHFNLCSPDQEMDFRFDTNCADGYLTLFGGEMVRYRDKEPSAWIKQFSYYYPSDHKEAVNPLVIRATPIQLPLYAGENRVTGSADGTFAMGDGIKVVIRFTADVRKYIQCGFPCFVWCAYQALIRKLENSECAHPDYEDDYGRLMQANVYVNAVLLGNRCGKNVDEYIEKLKDILEVEQHPCGDAEEMKLAEAAKITPKQTPQVNDLNFNIS